VAPTAASSEWAYNPFLGVVPFDYFQITLMMALMKQSNTQNQLQFRHETFEDK
jgi:hypothetical protein